MRTRKVLTMIFANMAPISKWQRQFLTVLLTTIFAIRGRVNFTNLARFSPCCEQTFRRHFQKLFDWIEFNLAVLALAPTGPGRSTLIGAIDCTFISKTGKNTYGLDRFWSSCHNSNRRGLEVSVLALIRTESRETFPLDAAQTPPGLTKAEESDYSRIDFYLEQVTDCLRRTPERLERVQYFVADGNYAKVKVLTCMSTCGRDLITRLRSDANLRYLYTGPRKNGPGAPKQYDGKVHFDDLRRFDYVGALCDRPQVDLYTKRLNSPHFKRDFRVVVLVDTTSGSYVVLASTDCSQSARQVVRFYRLRFQIELLFRDAKQFAGLCHCQARSQKKLDFHFNMSLAAINVARLESVLYHEGLSLNSYVRRAYNRWLVGQLLSKLGLTDRFPLNHTRVRQVVRMGSMTG